MESRAIARVADRKAVAPKGHASGRANGQSKVSWGSILAQAPRRGERNWRAVGETRTPTPNAAAPRFWVNDLEGTNTGTLLAGRPKRRGATGLSLFFSVVGNRERPPRRERDDPLASQPNRAAQPKQPGAKPPNWPAPNPARADSHIPLAKRARRGGYEGCVSR